MHGEATFVTQSRGNRRLRSVTSLLAFITAAASYAKANHATILLYADKPDLPYTPEERLDDGLV
jgi:hypothetical protein